LKKVFKVYYKLLRKPCNAHLWQRLVSRLGSFEAQKKLVKFLESRECVHSYRNGKERVLTSEREAKKDSLISSLCYRIKQKHVAEFLMDPVFNFSMQAVSNELNQYFAAPSIAKATLSAS
jgi:hypothetical protein